MILGCQIGTGDNTETMTTFLRINPNGKVDENELVKEMLKLDYKTISLQFDYKDTVEVDEFLEYFEPVDDDGIFMLSNKFINKFGDEGLTRLDITEVDTKNNKCAKHFAGISELVDTVDYYAKDTLLEPVESRSFFIDKKEYFIYKIVKVDSHMGGCDISIVSPEFGFLFGRGSFSSADFFKVTKNKIANQLIDNIKKDEAFITCKDTGHHHHHHH